MRRSLLLRWSVHFAAAGSLLVPGCKSPSWFMPGAATTTTAAATSPANTIGGVPLGQYSAPPTAAGGAVNSTPAAGPGGVVLASLAQVRRTVTDAIKIPTSVTPAVDPVKLDNEPKNPAQVAADLHYHAGYFFETQSKPSEAASHYKEVLQKAPQDARALAGYGRVLARLGNTVEAEDYLQRACAQAPQDPAPQHDLAQFYNQQKNLDAAIRCERQAVTLQPNHPQYRVSLAHMLLDCGNHAEATQVLTAIYGDAMACFHVGCMLSERQQSQLARQYLQQALALNPGLAPAREKLDRWGFAALPPQPSPGTATAQ